MANLAMPQLGESVTEGTIVKWLKQVGDTVKAEEPLVEIETEKVNVEVPSPWAGVLTAILVPEGQTVDVGVDLASIDGATVASTTTTSAGGAASPAAPATLPPLNASNASAPSPEALEAHSPVPSSNRSEGFTAEQRQRYSPAVLRLAQEHQIDLSTISGSGFGGRVTRKDVAGWLEQQQRGPQHDQAAIEPALAAIQESAATPAQAARPPLVEVAPVASPVGTSVETPAIQHAAAAGPAVLGGDEDLEPLTATRRAIARHMVQSVQASPHAWMAIEVDVSRLVRLRDGMKADFHARERFDLTYLPFMVKATVLALRENPRLNASWSEQGIVIKRRLNIGIAVDTDEGLVVPVIHDADNYTVAGLSRVIHDLAERARSRRLTLTDVEGGTFTVDNTGVFGSVVSAPIINQPQAAIVTMEAIVKRPVVVDDAIAIRSIMNCCISFDHRILDGGQIGRFMRGLKQQLESFGDQTPIY